MVDFISIGLSCWQLILGVELCCPYHHLEILGKLLSIFIGGNRGEQLRFVFFLSPFEVGVNFFFRWQHHAYPLWAIHREGCILVLGEHFREIAWPCIGLGVGAWLSAHLVIPIFYFKMFWPTWCAQDKPPSFVGPWFISLHMWPMFKPQGFILSLHSWWGEDDVTDAIWDVIPSIVKDIGFQVANEQTHILPQPTL